VAADGVPPVPVAEHLAQPVGLAQPGGDAEDVADRDRIRDQIAGVDAPMAGARSPTTRRRPRLFRRRC
jgi:hypothetical protein